MDEQKILEIEHQDHSLDVFACLRRATLESKKKLLSQVVEIFNLGRGENKLTPEEYYYYRLYDDSIFSLEDKEKFLGKNAQTPIYLRCNTPTWWFVAHDKLAFYGLMRGLDLPVPEIRAICHPFRTFGPVPALRDAAKLGTYLAKDAHYPMFGKPVTGMWSIGISALAAVDPETARLELADGRSVAIEDYAAEVTTFGKDGYLFQEKLRPHPFVADVCGDRIATVRLVVVLQDRGPEILRAVWKLPAGSNLADNFWRPGNLLGDVDPDSGAIRRVVVGAGPDQRIVEEHPDSGRRLVGETLPAWEQLKDLCLQAAAALPELRLQAWDIAICERGPVLLELNIGGDFNLPQLAGGKGLLDDRFRRFLKSCRKNEGGFWARRSRRRIAERNRRWS